MSKEELKLQYRLKKISTKEYFLALGKIIAAEAPVCVTKTPDSPDILSIFDGELPLFSK